MGPFLKLERGWYVAQRKPIKLTQIILKKKKKPKKGVLLMVLNNGVKRGSHRHVLGSKD